METHGKTHGFQMIHGDGPETPEIFRDSKAGTEMGPAP